MTVFDRDVALENLGGDADLLADLVTVFVQEYPVLLEELLKRIASGDAREVIRAAHAIKGALAPFAAQQAFDAAEKLELLGERGDLSVAPVGVDDLEREIDRLRQAMREAIGQED